MATRTTAGRVLLAATVVAAALIGGLATDVGVAAGGVAVDGTAGVGAAGGQEECSFPVTETDATGTEVTVEEEPDRVVTLAPSAAQTMWEIGAREKVVGASQHAGYLEGAESRRNVSGSGDAFVNVEAVVAAEPDLVLAPDVVSPETVDQLRDAGLVVFKFGTPGSIEGIQEKTLLTGRLVGECDGARETVDWMDAELATVERAVEGQDRPRVLYVFFGFTPGEGTYQDDVITTAGGVNVAAEANISGFRTISDEVVAEQDPEYIVLNGANPTVPERAAYQGTTAVREDNVVVVDENHMSQAAPRVVLVVRQLARAFHPEAYAAANATPSPSPTTAPTATPGVTASPTREPTVGTPTPTPTATGSPGFGLAVAAIALLSAATLARRR